MNIREEHIFTDINHTNKYEAIKHIIDNSLIDSKIKDVVFKKVKEREELQATSVGNRVGVAHAKTDTVDKITVLLGISKSGVNYESHDGEDVNLIFVVLTPINKAKEYLRVLSQISKICRNDREDLDKILKLNDKKEILENLGIN